ncbi:8-oxoguanine DNA glycosylase [Metarhizium album ARSEF 1941]|uniref:DNA-(apurinic or apyrimidinic site) lyase n=1 Tax=Metarhizium album (strain ARSEF 1941) TaxID=1081103 RepID=A0A0B2WR27_METAS|nr:8-oxoguanine DNA glycosylase [Metarhizium album ARSEF 1941]KHN96468.1 8-oxoguanine DNA glycosylase [Metarhizium album ARSEF 1941]
MGDEWTCTLQGRILSLKQDPSYLHYRVTWPEHQGARPPPPPACKVIDEHKPDDTEELLRRYFSLNLDLGALYDQWSNSDPNFQKKAPEFKGVRILSQDVWEALICFICSSNNNISRISQMAHKLCTHYGPLIGYVDGEPMHDFPGPESLTGKRVEAHLRELGFGYRAKYIADTARAIALEKPTSWLESLRNPRHSGPRLSSSAGGGNPTYREAHEALLSLTGVGPKVADCIAQRDYKFGKSKAKTFNKATYDAVGDHFRRIWGDYAGWAHSVLFAADLREFSSRKGKTQVVEVLEPVLVKSETREEEGVSNRPRKRRSVVDAKLRNGTVLGDATESKVVETIPSQKRRKTKTR